MDNAHMVRIMIASCRRSRRLGLRLMAAALLSLAAGFAAPADAAGRRPLNKSLDWLMKEPVTLLDLGIFRLKEDLNRVARLFLERGYAALQPQTGVYFDWRERRIIAYLSVRETIAPPSLESIFSPEGPGNISRPKTMAEDLLGSVQFEVSILPPNPLGTGPRRSARGAWTPTSRTSGTRFPEGRPSGPCVNVAPAPPMS